MGAVKGCITIIFFASAVKGCISIILFMGAVKGCMAIILFMSAGKGFMAIIANSNLSLIAADEIKNICPAYLSSLK